MRVDAEWGVYASVVMRPTRHDGLYADVKPRIRGRIKNSPQGTQEKLKKLLINIWHVEAGAELVWLERGGMDPGRVL